MTPLKTICAWCGVLLTDGRVDDDGGVSHGICPGCLKKWEKKP